MTYLTAKYKVLLDMHIGDWDEAFLADFDPQYLVSLYQQAGVEGALLYFKSHIGLNYWAADASVRHPVAGKRDIAGELVGACRSAGIAPAAYVSLTFDRSAAIQHPEWRQCHSDVGAERFDGLLGPKHGLCCPNNRDYRNYERQLVSSIAGGYDVDAIFLDMIFFSMVCRCDACENRSVAELGFGVPETVDWNDARWCQFHEARSRWLDEFYRHLRDAIREVKPDMAVTHNLASELSGWVGAGQLQSLNLDSYPAGDLYGGASEQLTALLVMRNAARVHQSAPPEYMTSFSPDLTRHGAVNNTRELEVQAYAAAMFGANSLFIDAVDPQGRVHEMAYQRLGNVISNDRGLRPVGDTAEMVANLAVYYSPPSRVSVTDTGAAHEAHREAGALSDHERAFFGTCRILQEMHVPFGVVTPDALGELSTYQALIVPNVARMSTQELDTIRSYVNAGGHLYSSGQSSLWSRESGRLSDFGLSDVIGASVTSLHQGSCVYARFGDDANGPYDGVSGYVGHYSPESARRAPRVYDALQLPRIDEVDGGAEVLARLTVPYGYPAHGTFEDKMFSSSHSSPPWRDLTEPVAIRLASGNGVSVYSTLPFEEGQDRQSEAAFASLLGALEFDNRITVTGPRALWVRAFDDVSAGVMIVNLLNYGDTVEPGLIAVGDVRVDAPNGWLITQVTSHGDALTSDAVSVESGRALVASGVQCAVAGQFVCELSRAA